MRASWRRHPKHGMELRMIEAVLEGAWCRETASPAARKDWTPMNPAWGQCAVTAAALHHWFRGDGIEVELLRAEIPGFGSHYWIRLPDGTEVDMTRDQFPERTVVPPGEPRTIEYLLDSENAARAFTRERFERLVETSEAAFAQWLFEQFDKELSEAAAERAASEKT